MEIMLAVKVRQLHEILEIIDHQHREELAVRDANMENFYSLVEQEMEQIRNLLKDVLDHNITNVAILGDRLTIVKDQQRTPSTRAPVHEDDPAEGEMWRAQEKGIVKMTTSEASERMIVAKLVGQIQIPNLVTTRGEVLVMLKPIVEGEATRRPIVSITGALEFAPIGEETKKRLKVTGNRQWLLK